MDTKYRHQTNIHLRALDSQTYISLSAYFLDYLHIAVVELQMILYPSLYYLLFFSWVWTLLAINDHLT